MFILFSLCDILHIPHHHPGQEAFNRTHSTPRIPKEKRISRRRRPKMESIRQIEWRKSRKRRENLRLDGGRGGARAAEVLTSGQGFMDLVPQPLIGESTSTPLSNSHDATLALIVVPLLFHCCQIISNLVTFYLLCFLFLG